ncbi:MAG: protein kinase [Solirubrobacterales bacterium]|nr:protein kinase [Solirubrobacterales bacterium]
MTALGNLSRYRDIKTLGSGGMATVVLAEDTLLGREVALKQLAAQADVRALLRLRREALIGASLSHPNLVSIYDVLTADEDSVVIVMEYVKGENLRDALRRKRKLGVSETLRILGGVAAALDTIHRRQIVHRDVKPANILLGTDGTVKLADLGIAAVPDRTRITTAGGILGSFSYMAPEQLTDAPATPAIDIYALALVAFEALSGVKARREPNPVALAHAIANQPPPDIRKVWPQAPDSLANLLIKALSPDPGPRPRSANELVKRLRAALDPENTVPLAGFGSDDGSAAAGQRPSRPGEPSRSSGGSRVSRADRPVARPSRRVIKTAAEGAALAAGADKLEDAAAGERSTPAASSGASAGGGVAERPGKISRAASAAERQPESMAAAGPATTKPPEAERASKRSAEASDAASASKRPAEPADPESASKRSAEASDAESASKRSVETSAPEAVLPWSPIANSAPRRWRPRHPAVTMVPLALVVVALIVGLLLLTSGSQPRSHSSASPGQSPRSNNGGGQASAPGRGASSGQGATGASRATSKTAGSVAGASAVSSAGGGAAGSAANDPASAVESFYQLAASHRYTAAWSLADSTFRNQLQGFDSFEAGQAAERSITFDQARVVSRSPGAATVAVRTVSVRTDGTQHCQGTVDLSQGAASWLLHLIHIDCS